MPANKPATTFALLSFDCCYVYDSVLLCALERYVSSLFSLCKSFKFVSSLIYCSSAANMNLYSLVLYVTSLLIVLVSPSYCLCLILLQVAPYSRSSRSDESLGFTLSSLLMRRGDTMIAVSIDSRTE